ncbi:uncharacterized protein RJT21DRAFT_5067 [Scheffersomyces amazonensis]|uniref:uncharacterized protein n=1 Tax=Scheffersomyces amazonensis TaxID=1078765 RepID=UPI00315CE405
MILISLNLIIFTSICSLVQSVFGTSVDVIIDDGNRLSFYIGRNRIDNDACLERILPDRTYYGSSNTLDNNASLKTLRDITITELDDTQLGLLLLGVPWFGLATMLDFYNSSRLDVEHLIEPIINAIRNKGELEPDILELCRDYLNGNVIPHEIDNESDNESQHESQSQSENQSQRIDTSNIEASTSHSTVTAYYFTQSRERIMDSTSVDNEIGKHISHIWVIDLLFSHFLSRY